MDKQLFTEFETALKHMVGQPCWSAQTSGIGSLFSLQIGQKKQRDQPMAHPDFKISTEEGIYRGEFILYVEDCPWRIETSEKILTTWLDDNIQDGAMNKIIQQFVGRKIGQVDVSYPGMDLTLRFEGELTLRLFPDQIDADEGDNYSLTSPEKTYIIAAQSTLYAE
jgi:hypothetical protein